MNKKVAILGFAHGHVMAYGQQWVDRPEHGVDVVTGWDHDAASLSQSAESFPGMK